MRLVSRDRNYQEISVPADRVPIRVEVVALMRLATPLILTYSFMASINIVSLHYVGLLGETDALAGVALASSLFNVIGYSFGYGMVGPLDTFVSQTVGAIERDADGTGKLNASQLNKYRHLGVLLSRALLIVWLTCLPICAIFFWSATILHGMLRQPLEVSEITQTFCRYSLASMPLFMTFETLKRYLQCQGDTRASLLAMGVAGIVNWGCHVAFVRNGTEWYAMGYRGAAVAITLSYASLLVTILTYIWWNKSLAQSWHGFSRQSLQGWRTYTQLAIPSTVMLCAEWWAFELCAIVAGTFGPVSLSAHSVIQNSVYALYMIPFGLSIAATIRVGNFLGAGEARKAMRVAHLSMAITFVGMVCNSLALYFGRYAIADAFMNDVQGATQSQQDASGLFRHFIVTVIPIAAAYQVFDGLQALCQGILRGCGHQRVGAVFTLSSYYVVCIPIGLVLAFKARLGGFMPLAVDTETPTDGMGEIGLWLGIACGVTAMGIMSVAFVMSIDWHKECEKARERVELERDATGHHDADGQHGEEYEMLVQQSAAL